MIALFQFQEDAAAQIADRFIEYLGDPIVRGSARHPRAIPFFQALSALTGAGKTAILAEAVSQLSDTMPTAPVIIWLSRGRVVVRQTFANLGAGGKYHHLLDNAQVNLLAEYDPAVVEEFTRPLVYLATVGTFNQRDKEEGSLTIFRSEVDTTEISTWNAIRMRLSADRVRRPLFVVYDEAHNLSDQQTELLLELEPDGFLLASATMRLPARLSSEVDALRRGGWSDDRLITKVKSTEVVAAGLVKNSLILGGYNTPMEETVSAMLADMAQAESDAREYALAAGLKAIYVCNTNVVADDNYRRDDPRQPFLHRQAPPILIWRYLTEQQGIDPRTVAVYASLSTNRDFPLPDDFVLFGAEENDYERFVAGDFRHIIFNLGLQEGWDDPFAYFAYIDKSMDSPVRVTQIVGRVLRQPNATHYSAERLNSAHFYVRVDRNETFNEVLQEVGASLGAEVPEVRIIASAPGRARPIEYAAKSRRAVPRIATISSKARGPVEDLLASLSDYRRDTANTKGEGSRRIAKQWVGESASDGSWESFEQSSLVSARWVLHREIQRRFREAIGVVNLAESRLDAIVGVGSPAYKHVATVAEQIVSAYVDSVFLKQQGPNPYVVGPLLAREADVRPYSNALHDGYAGLNSLEAEFAAAIDRTGLTWCRNPARSGYGIPLISMGATDNYYPDFLIWVDDVVICLDTKGAHLIADTAMRKLLTVRARDSADLNVMLVFVSEGRWSRDLSLETPDGFTMWGLGDDGRRRAVHYGDLDGLVSQLAAGTAI